MSRRSRRLETPPERLANRLVDSKIDGLALFAGAAVAAMVPDARAALDDRLRCEQAALKIAAIVGPTLLERYLAEAERRWEFANDLNVTTRSWGRRRADVYEALVAEISAGIV